MLLVKLINTSNAITAWHMICIQCFCICVCHDMWPSLLMQQSLEDQTAWCTQALCYSAQARGFNCFACHWSEGSEAPQLPSALALFFFVTESILPEYVQNSGFSSILPLRDKMHKVTTPSAPFYCKEVQTHGLQESLMYSKQSVS